MSGDEDSHASIKNRATTRESFPSSSQPEGPGCISECFLV